MAFVKVLKFDVKLSCDIKWCENEKGKSKTIILEHPNKNLTKVYKSNKNLL